MSGLLSVCAEDIIVASNTDFISKFDGPGQDFVQCFPPELSNKLFTYLTDQDIFACSKVCCAWRRVINNNIQWKLRCVRKGWYKMDGNTDPFKWTDTLSHVGEINLQFRPSPLFKLPPVASLRIGTLCDWGKYYRQCYHRENNWKYGRYVIHKFKIPEQVVPAIFNCCSCNGKIFAAGTTTGHILIWSVIGRPTFLKTIMAVRKRIEVEHLHLTDIHMIVLCQTGLLQCYNISEDELSGKEQFEIIFQLKIGGSYEDEFTYFFKVERISSDQVSDIYQLGQSRIEENILIWIRELYGDNNTPWLHNEYMVSDIFFSVHEQKIILTGIASSSVYIWDIHTGNLIKCLRLPHNVQVCYKTFLFEKKRIYLSTRRILHQHQQLPTSTFHLLVYDLNRVLKADDGGYADDYESHSMLEEVCVDKEEKRLAWVSQDSLILGKDLEKKKTLFIRQGQSYIDNLMVYEDLVIYHQYDGLIIAIDWNGIPVYQVEMRLGIVRGLQCCGQFLISGGDAKNLSVWNNRTGQAYHKVHHQPCRIEHLYADETKVITLGREDPPVLIGYW